MKKEKTITGSTFLNLFLALCLTLITSCSKPPEEEIIGKWKRAADDIIMEFFGDGTVSGSTGDGNVLTGSYKWIDGTRIQVVFEGTAALWEVGVSSSELRIIFAGGLGGAVYKRL